jgi:hypothetical protein
MPRFAARTVLVVALVAAGCAAPDQGRVEEPSPSPPVARVRVHPVADLVVPWPDRVSAIRGNCVLYVPPSPGAARRHAASVEDRARLLEALREGCSVPDGGTWLMDGDFLVVRGDPDLQESVASWLERRRTAAQ